MAARPRFTYANVVATIALVVAMSSGGAYAATLIKTSQIADGAVTTRKLADAAVTNRKIADAAVKRQNIAANVVTGAKVADRTLTGADLADGSITGANILDESITGANILDGSIGAADLQIWARRAPAFARVRWDGELLDGSGITAEMITRPVADEEETPITGLYCFHDLPFGPAAVSATGSLYFSGPSIATATQGRADECPVGTMLTVKLYVIVASNWTAVDGTFNLVIWP